MRFENTWPEIRDHSFIQNHSRSSDSQLLLFSSLTHLLQGSGQRTPDTRSETIPSSRITPDLQIHSFFSSVHSLIFYRVQIREHLTRDQRPFLHPESLQVFRFTASSLQFTHSSSTGFRSETIPSSRITPDLQIHSFFSSSDHIEASPIWGSSRVWQLNMLEFVFGWARIIFLETLPNNMWWCWCCLTTSLKVFWLRDSTVFCKSTAVVLEESLATQSLLLAVH